MTTREMVLPTYQSDIHKGLAGKLRHHRPSLRRKPGTVLPPNTVRGSIVDLGQEYNPTGTSLYPNSNLGFTESYLPTEINVGNQSFPLSASEEIQDIKSLLQYGKAYRAGIRNDFEARYGNPDTRKLLQHAYEHIKGTRLKGIRKELTEGSKLDGSSDLLTTDNSELQEVPIQESVSDVSKIIDNEAWDTTQKWFKSLVKNNKDYTVHNIVIEIGGKAINMRRLIIGSIDYTEKPDAWEVDKICLESLIFMNEEFGMEIPEDLLIITLADTDGNESLYSELRQNSFSNLGQCQGVADRDLGIFISVDRASQRVESTERVDDKHVRLEITRVMDSSDSEMTHRHEIAHLIDSTPYMINSHREGLAVAMEYAFDPERLVSYRRLYQKFATKRLISEQYLQRLMSSIDLKPFQTYEIYYTSGALFSFIASKVGYKAFGNFYRLLTGESVAVAVDNNIIAMQSVGDDEDYIHGAVSTARSLRNSLRAVLMLEGYDEAAEGKTTDEIIDAYLEEFCDLINIKDEKDEG